MNGKSDAKSSSKYTLYPKLWIGCMFLFYKCYSMGKDRNNIRWFGLSFRQIQQYLPYELLIFYGNQPLHYIPLILRLPYAEPCLHALPNSMLSIIESWE